MAVEGSGQSENVFIQPPRVGFGEPPVSTAPSSLLAFADMVLSFDRKTVLEKATKSSDMVMDIDGSRSREADHTYASSGSFRTTRSQTAKAAMLSSTSPDIKQSGDVDLQSDFHANPGSNRDLDLDLEKDTLNCDVKDVKPSQLHLLSQSPPSAVSEPFLSSHNYSVRSKRCSSVENISSETKLVGSHQEWPQSQPKLEKHSRKSCSSEEVDNKSNIKLCKSSECVQKASSSSLHRFVNNTLEFPCWPRKADHTYATATWDGTAASQNLLGGDHRVSQSEMIATNLEDHPMEDLENQIPPPLFQDNPVAPPQYSHQGALFKKDDHTYVKHGVSGKSSVVFEESHCRNGNTSSNMDTGIARHRFSSATFPRLKSREDHTYFHSGLSANNGSSTGGREWVSTQTVGSVASSEISQDMQIEETYRSLHSFSQSASAKKDHNYSTSA